MSDQLTAAPTPTLTPSAPAAPAPSTPSPTIPDPAGLPSPPASPIPADPLAPAAAVDPWAGVEDAELKAFVGTKTPADVAKELKAAQALIGKKAIGIPDANSTPEQQAAFHKARGVPETAEGYKFDDVIAEITKDLPAGLITADPEREKRFREFAKASNLAPGEARELIKRELSHEIETKKASAAASAQLQQQTSDLITQNWGPKKDEYTQDANNWMRHMGLGDDALAVVNGVLGTKPEARLKFLDVARQQGAALREGGQPVEGMPNGGNVGNMSPQAAGQAKRDYLQQGDNQKAFMDPNHPNFKTVSDYVGKLARRERGL